MTREEVRELQKVSTEVQRWIESGNLNEPPVINIRRLARLASLAANVIETMMSQGRRGKNS